MKRYRPRASFSVFTPEVHTTNHQRFQKKVDISHNLQYLCTPNQKVYHLQQLGGQPSGTFSSPSPMRKARMAESVDALVSNTSGAIRAGSIPAPGTCKCKCLIFKHLHFSFCTTVAPQNGLFWGKIYVFLKIFLYVLEQFRKSRMRKIQTPLRCPVHSVFKQMYHRHAIIPCRCL